METFQHIGLWWLPEDEQSPRTGTLTFSVEHGMTLEVVEAFSAFSMATTPRMYPTIFGFTKDGMFVTLVDSTEASASHSWPGLSTQTLRSRVAFIGHMFLDREHRKFPQIAIQYSHLADWLAISGFEETVTSQNNRFSEYHLHFKHPDEFIASVANTMITIEYALETRKTRWEVNNKQTVQFKIADRRALSLEEWLQQFVSPLQNFLTLATDKLNTIIDLFVYTGVEGDRNTDELSDPIDNPPIQVVFQPTFYDQFGADGNNQLDTLFSLQDVGISFPGLMNRWFHLARPLETVFNLYFGTRYNPGKYQEPRFLNMAHAVELYHRIRYKNTVLPKSEFRARVKAIVDSAPEEYKAWINEQPAFSNEPRFIQRIDELYRITEDVIGQLYSDQREFTTKVRDTRNYYTHYNPDLGAEAAHGQDLFWLTETLGFMLIRCFLDELGVPPQRCVELFEQNHRFVFARSQLGKPADNSRIDENELRRRDEAVRQIDAIRERLFNNYGELPDSVELIRDDRAR